jgi:hypothetical protein
VTHKRFGVTQKRFELTCKRFELTQKRFGLTPKRFEAAPKAPGASGADAAMGVGCRAMRRLLRILLNAATVVSLVLAVAIAALWVRGYFTSDRLFWQSWFDIGDRSYWVQDVVRSGAGGVGMNRVVQSYPTKTPSGQSTRQEHEARYGKIPFLKSGTAEYPQFKVGVGDKPVWGGFKRGGFVRPDPEGRPHPSAYAWQYVVPYWAILPPVMILPAIRVVRHFRRRRAVTIGLCPTCGYDLRATPDRCPECGNVLAALPPNAPPRSPADRSPPLD